jgi:hypothetical protein
VNWILIIVASLRLATVESYKVVPVAH